MSILTKLAGAWKTSKLFFVKVAGVWKPGRMLYTKVAGQWRLVYARPRYAVWAQGLVQTVEPAAFRGFWVNFNAPLPGSFGRSYNLIQFNSRGMVTYQKTFDLHADGIPETQLANANAFTEDLNKMLVGQLFVIYTFDEPERGRLLGNLPAAMYRIGVSQSLYENFHYRGAYCILGQVGRAPFFENYIGADNPGGIDDGDPNAATGLRFILEDGVPIILDTH